MSFTKRIVKGIVSSLLCIALLFSSSIVLGATTTESIKNKGKVLLMEKHKNEKKNLTDEQIDKRDKKVDQEMATLINSGASQAEIDSMLESKYHIYRYKTEQLTDSNSQVMTVSSDSSDVSLSSVWVYYDAETTNWILSASGYWINDNWYNDLQTQNHTSYEYNVGGQDCMAITLYETNNGYGTTLFKGVTGWIGNQRDIIKQGYNTTCSNNYQHLVAVKFQDYTHDYGDMGSDLSYVGKTFGITGRYSSTFANYHGKVCLNYVHTFKTTGVSSVSYSIAQAPSVVVTYVNELYDWENYGSEAIF